MYRCVAARGVSSLFEVKNMENSSVHEISNKSDREILRVTTESASFFDPTWQLAVTIEFYFQYAIIAIGIFGTVANAFVLYALVTYHLQEAKKRAINLLMINQNLLDLSSCVLLIITFSIRVNDIYLTGALGYFLCTVFVSESAALSTLNASVVNLMTVTVERYLKVVHPFWSKKHLKRWMIHAAMAFAWIMGILTIAPAMFVSTVVKDGMCLPFYVWGSPAVKQAINLWHLFTVFIVPVILFVFCYARIVVVMRRQIRAMAAHNAAGQQNASQMRSKQIKWNIIKTMLITSLGPDNTKLFVVFDTNEIPDELTINQSLCEVSNEKNLQTGGTFRYSCMVGQVQKKYLMKILSITREELGPSIRSSRQ